MQTIHRQLFFHVAALRQHRIDIRLSGTGPGRKALCPQYRYSSDVTELRRMARHIRLPCEDCGDVRVTLRNSRAERNPQGDPSNGEIHFAPAKRARSSAASLASVVGSHSNIVIS